MLPVTAWPIKGVRSTSCVAILVAQRQSGIIHNRVQRTDDMVPCTAERRFQLLGWDSHHIIADLQVT